MKQIICFSNCPWSSTPTRTQHLIARMKNAEVLFFDPPLAQGQQAPEKPRRVRPNVTVYSLPPIMSGEGIKRFLFHRNQRKIFHHIEVIMARHNFKEPLLWVTSPENVHLLDYLAFRGMVYDCDRCWKQLPAEWEQELTATADVVFTVSEGLKKRLSPYNKKIFSIPNGANHPMFSSKSVDIPMELADVSYPLLGWVGTIRSDLDLTPITLAAKARPDWTFALVGRTEENSELSVLSQMKNVLLIGERPAMDIPDYIGRFNVCLDLAQARDADSDIIPCRFYEYLSTGKPIVSLNRFYKDSAFSDVIYYAADSAKFVNTCKRALANDTLWLPLRRQELGSSCAWSARASEVMRILESEGF